MFKKKKKCNNGLFWFADLMCLWIVERGKWKVFRRIKYALFYSTEDNKWQNRKLSVSVRCSSFDGGCRVIHEARLSSVMKVLDLVMWHLLLFCTKCLSILFPHQKCNVHSFLCHNNLFIFLTDTENLCPLPDSVQVSKNVLTKVCNESVVFLPY